MKKYYTKSTKAETKSNKGLGRLIRLSISLIVLIFVITSYFILVKRTSAAWYDDSFAYRQKITFGNTGSADANKKVKFDIDTATLISAGKMQSDCDDSRFTDFNGRKLKYYLDTSGGACNTSSTDYYVLVPIINAGNTELYFYYGNPSVSSGSQTAQFSESTFSPTSGPTASSEEKGSVPALIWKFDTGFSTTSEDSTINNNDGTISGATWSQESQCLSEKCLAFDGSNDYVSKTYSSDSELDPSTSSFTVSAWFKHASTQSGTDTILSRADGLNGVGYKIYMDSSGFVCFGIDGSAGSFPSDSACSTTSYADSKWHNVVVTKSTTSSITLYIDGNQIAQDTSITSSSISGSSSPFYVGIDADGTSNPWTGFIDEVRIYPYLRNASQIKTDVTKNGEAKGVSVSMGKQEISDLSDGLVGYWKMDETSWNGTSGEVLDSSGNGTNGTGAGSISTDVSRYSRGGSFDGTNDSITLPTSLTSISNQATFSFWTKLSSNPLAGDTRIFSRYNYYSIRFAKVCCWATNGYFEFQVVQSGVSKVWSINNVSSSIGFDKWVHLSITWNNGVPILYVNGSPLAWSTSASNVSASIDNPQSSAIPYIGSFIGSSAYYTGPIDEFRIYDRALVNTEIQQLYSYAPGPVGYYDFNEKSGSTLQDKSGNDNAGTISGATYTLGKFGAGLDFDGSDDNVTRADDSDYDFAASDNFTVSTWVKHDGAISTNEDYILTKADTSNGGYKLYMDNSGDFCFDIDDDSSWTPDDTACTSAIDYDDSSWHYVTGVKTGTSRIDLFVDGKLVATDSSISATSTLVNTNALYVGIDRDGTSNSWDGVVDDVKIYNYIRTPAQIIEDMNGGHPMGGSPVGSQVAYWQIDEGYGTNVNDTTANNNDLTMSTASWTNSGKFGKAWNGTNANWLSRADDADFDFAENEDFTISLWVKSDSASNPGTTEYIVDKESTSAGYAIYATTSGTICFAIDDDATWSPDISSCSTTDFYDGTWHHITGIRDYSGTDKTYIYIDGKPIANTSDTTTATLVNADSLTIGDRNATNDGDEFTGDVDEVKIYRGTLTTDEILIDYHRGSSVKLGSLSDNSTYQKDAANQEYCVPGDSTSCASPIGEWKMDEASWTNDCSTDTVFDTSGNGNHGDSCPNTTGPTGGTIPGKIGKAGTFDGTDEYVDLYDTMNASLSTTYTVSVWMKTTTIAEGNVIASYRSTSSATPIYFQMDHNNADARFVVRDGAGNIATASFASALTTNTWYHITGVRNGNTTRVYVNGVEGTSATASIGTTSHDKAIIGGIVVGVGSTPQTSTLFKGTIDNLRIYNYVRTPAQIAWEYNRGAPLAHYKLDECSGSTTNNSISSSYPGTITIGASGSNTSTGTCSSGTSTEAWNNGTSGKWNSSLDLDGTDDYVQISDSAPLRFDASNVDFSLFAWVKRTTTGTEYIISKEDADNDGYRLQFNSSDQVLCSEDATDVTSTSTITDTNWHLVGCTIDRDGNGQIYIDGKANGSTVSMGTDAMATTSAIRVGTRSYTSTSYLNGQIDDVRIYNYALTAGQVRNLFNEGASVRFGPASGNP